MIRYSYLYLQTEPKYVQARLDRFTQEGYRVHTISRSAAVVDILLEKEIVTS